MIEKIYQPGECYENPLIIRKLLNTPLIYSPEKEIVYGEKHRYSYTEFYKRIGMLANGLAKIGIKPGDTVAVFDYDSHRYLECFFAIPMMGAVLQTVNWRLSADQLIYTINHAEAKAIILNADFSVVLKKIMDRLWCL